MLQGFSQHQASVTQYAEGMHVHCTLEVFEIRIPSIIVMAFDMFWFVY